MEVNKIICGNCLDVMKTFPDGCIDSIITDPPYGLKFMGKKWDCDVPKVEVWQECLRVLKPGGYLLSFAGTRTQHRMACNIEDAGFEIRDMIAWVYGSGFPKSLNVGKAVDKLQGNKREMVGNEIKAKPTFHSQNVGGGIRAIDNIKIPKGNSPYEGYGTALKPALEPITVARKPLSEKTVAANVLKHGTGGINIDGCRVKTDEDQRRPSRGGDNGLCSSTTFKIHERHVEDQIKQSGRFPANFCHDGSDEVLEGFPETINSGKRVEKKRVRSKGWCNSSPGEGVEAIDNFGDSGSAARFFYCAKASKSERGKFNNHPTVKPIALMKYLQRLVTPKGGLTLDPYCGSGTSFKAAIEEGFEYIGIDEDKDSVDIGNKRILSAEPQLF